MTSTIGNLGSSYSSMMMQGMSSTQSNRSTGTTPEQMAQALFSQLDSAGNGYITKSELENAFSALSGNNTSSSTATTGTSGGATGSSAVASADSLFAQLDSSGTGQVTESQFESGLKKIGEQLASQAMQSRLSGAAGSSQADGMGGMPPPPPPAPDSASATGSSASGTSSTASDSSSASGTSSTTLANDAQWMAQITSLMQSYGILGSDSATTGAQSGSTLSVTG